MKCICGQEFCFSCNHQWDEAHKTSPEGCVKPKAQEELGVKEESSELEKLVDRVIFLSRRMNGDLGVVKRTEELLTKQ